MITPSDINRMYQQYFSTTGKEPSRIYLGREEYRDMRILGEIYIHGSVLNDGRFTQKIMGMLVFEVDEERHLFVC